MYFKDLKNNIFAFNSLLEMEKFKPGLIEISDTEKEELLKPTAEQLTEQRLSDIKARLIQIDNESIRPLRAVAAGTSLQFDTDKLAALENERAALASELVTLNV